MSEILWVSLSLKEKNTINNVVNLIGSKNLTTLSINQLIEKLEKNQAVSWLDVLSQYNSIHNMNSSNKKMLSRAKCMREKFREQGYEALENREFPPNQLLSLIILCYTHPNSIGPKLSRALNKHDKGA